MNDELPATEEHPAETPIVEAERSEVRPVERQAHDPRRRLRELLAIPDRERSDALWDELIALEIELAPGNRALSPQADGGQRQDQGRRPEQQGRRSEQQGRRPEQQARRQDPASGKRPGKRFFKKPKRGPGGSGGPGGPSFQN